MERNVHRREGVQGREDEKKKEEQRKKTKKKRGKGIGKRKKMRKGFGGEQASNEKKKNSYPDGKALSKLPDVPEAPGW